MSSHLPITLTSTKSFLYPTLRKPIMAPFPALQDEENNEQGRNSYLGQVYPNKREGHWEKELSTA